MRRVAWPLVLVLACSAPSRDPHGDVDARGSDGVPDAPDRPLTASVMVFRDGPGDLPLAGAAVLSFTAGGEPFGRTASSTDGRASIVVPAGGTVVVVRPRPPELSYSGTNVSAVFAITTDVALEVGWIPQPRMPISTPLGKMKLDVTPMPGALRTYVYNGCERQSVPGDQPAQVMMAFATRCERPAYDFAAVAMGPDNEVLGSARLDQQPFVDGAEITIPATYTPATTAQMRVDHLPPDVSPAMLRTERRQGLPFFQRSGGELLEDSFDATWSVPDLGTEVELSVTLSSRHEVTTSWRRERLPASTSHVVSADQLLPLVTDERCDHVTRTASWTLYGSTQLADGSTVVMDFQTASEQRVDRWVITLPGGATQVVVPALPLDFGVTPDPGGRCRAFVGLYASERFDGYPAFAGRANREHNTRYSPFADDDSLVLEHSGSPFDPYLGYVEHDDVP